VVADLQIFWQKPIEGAIGKTLFALVGQQSKTVSDKRINAKIIKTVG